MAVKLLIEKNLKICSASYLPALLFQTSIQEKVRNVVDLQRRFFPVQFAERSLASRLKALECPAPNAERNTTKVLRTSF